MALRFNGLSPTGGTPFSSMPCSHIGNTAAAVGKTANFTTQWGRGERHAVKAAFGMLASNPPASEPPVAWTMADKGGDLAAENTINEDNSTTLTSLALGVALGADFTQDASITAAALSMITSMSINMQQEGQLDAGMQMTMNLAANLVQEGQVEAGVGLIAWMQAEMTQDADISDSNLRGTLSMAADIVSYTEFTAEGVRDAVWSAILANYPGAGSAGLALATASSGGVDYTALGVAVWNSVSRTLTAGAAPSTADIVAAIEAAIVSVNVKQVNDVTISGTGVPPTFDADGVMTDPGDPWVGV